MESPDGWMQGQNIVLPVPFEGLAPCWVPGSPERRLKVGMGMGAWVSRPGSIVLCLYPPEATSSPSLQGGKAARFLPSQVLKGVWSGTLWKGQLEELLGWEEDAIYSL